MQHTSFSLFAEMIGFSHCVPTNLNTTIVSQQLQLLFEYEEKSPKRFGRGKDGTFLPAPRFWPNIPQIPLTNAFFSATLVPHSSLTSRAFGKRLLWKGMSAM
jgi:hypothetical protein